MSGTKTRTKPAGLKRKTPSKGVVLGGRHPDENGLSAYHRRFVDEYTIDFDGCAALKRMGYQGVNARSISYNLRHSPSISAAIEARVQQQRARAKLTADHVIDQYRKIAFANALDFISIGEDGVPFVDIANLDRDRASAIETIEIDEVQNGAGQDEAGTGGGPEKETRPQRDKRPLRVRLKLKNSLHALDKLALHLGLFRPDAVEQTTVNFVIHNGPADTPKELLDITPRVVLKPPPAPKD